MKIVVIGCDKIGSSVVELLIKDGHEICVVDIESKRVQRACDIYEITGIVGNGASYDVQKKAGVDKCDVMIACTNIDEVNILCCLVAKDLGALHTVIINNNEDYYEQIENLRERFNIDLLVCPEKEAATEVSRVLRFPSALQVERFAEGKMELIDVIIPDESEFVGHTIADNHGKNYPDVQICAVERGGEVFIPSGNTVLEAGDRLSLASNGSGIVKYMKRTGLYQSRIKRVLILGGTNSALYLAKIISGIGIEVTIIESDFERCKYLSEALPKAYIIHGSDNDYELMRNEGLTDADAFVAFTSNNEKNIIASLYALNKNVPKVITAVDEKNLFSVVGEIDLGSVVSQNVLTATRILHFVKSLQDARDAGSKLDHIFTIAGGRAFVLEFSVTESFGKAGIPLKDLTIRTDTFIAMIIRDNKAIIPRGNDVILVGDKVVIVTLNESIDTMNEVLDK